MDDREITYEESRLFRQCRLAWPIVFCAAAAAMIWQSTLLLVFLVPIYFILTLYLLFWPCPRCGRLYSIRFHWFVGMAWPSGRCLHCGAPLAARRSGKNPG